MLLCQDSHAVRGVGCCFPKLDCLMRMLTTVTMPWVNVQIPHENRVHFVEDLCKAYCTCFQAVGIDMDIDIYR